MIWLALSFGLLAGMAAAPARAGGPNLQDLIRLHNQLDETCRGESGDDPRTLKACDEREEVSKIIKSMGYCMAYPAYTWHRC